MSAIGRLIDIMARLRDPATGCPWDRAQTFATIAPYTIEEACEVADAIERDAPDELRDELGDLLFQVVYHARMAEEQGMFAFVDVVDAICDKLVRRHPHVFGDDEVATAEAQTVAWEAHKAAERAGKGPASLLDDVPRALPALRRAMKLQQRAASVGFDWPDRRGALDKVREEFDELAAETGAGAPSPERVAAEFGDLLFALTNAARHLGVDPEQALRSANQKFIKRFKYIENHFNNDSNKMQAATLAELDALWDAAKRNAK